MIIDLVLQYSEITCQLCCRLFTIWQLQMSQMYTTEPDLWQFNQTVQTSGYKFEFT